MPIAVEVRFRKFPMTTHTKPTLLAIGVTGLDARSEALDVYTATTIREAIATMRLVYFDLLIVGLESRQLDVWDLMDRVLTAWPSQRWILAWRRITKDDEVHARSLGALLVLSELPTEPWLVDFTALLKRRDTSRRIPTLVSARAPSRTSNIAASVQTL
jgi:hypothetical protein